MQLQRYNLFVNCGPNWSKKIKKSSKSGVNVGFRRINLAELMILYALRGCRCETGTSPLCLLEEHEGQGVPVLLREFVLHASDGCAEEEGDEMLVGTFCPDLLEGSDVGCTVFKTDDEQGMTGSEKDKV